MTTNWNDLQFFLAIYEAKSLVGASRKLQVDETTVGRRLLALEQSLKTTLFVRSKKGYVPTPAGTKVLGTLLPVRAKLQLLQNQIEGNDQSFHGKVKLTMPESLAVNLVLPRLSELLSIHPELQVEFATSAQTINISKREADIAIRMFKPKNGTLYASKLGKLRFAFYASKAYLTQNGTLDARNLKQHVLINYPDSEATHSEALILQKLRKSMKTRIQVNNRNSLLAAIQRGFGIGLLPEIMVETDKDLVLISAIDPIDHDTWMVVHSDLKKNARVRTTADFLKAIISPRLR